MTEQRYKFLRLADKEIRSDSGNLTWSLEEWQEQDGKLELCGRGFHCSRRIVDAFGYVPGEILAVVEVDGASVANANGDKEAWSRMRLVKVYQWRKKDSVALSIFAAGLVLENYEKLYPDDKRPRQAIEAARKWLQEPTEENQSAARAAALAAKRAAALAARAAARSAESAAWAAARSAAWSAKRTAAWAVWAAARAAAESAAEAAIEAKIEAWMQAHLAEMLEYVPPVAVKK